MRKEYFVESENQEYKVIINGIGDYPRFNIHVKNGDTWSPKLVVNDNIWENLAVKFMGILNEYLSENNIKGYTFKTNDIRRVNVYERFLNNAGYDLERGDINIIRPKQK